jgi:hypothetical protein
MKSLDPDCRRIIDDASRADVPSADAEARIWQGLQGQLSRPLPPTARAAQEALAAAKLQPALAGASFKLMIGVLSVGLLALGVALVVLLARGPRTLGVPPPSPPSPASSAVVSTPLAPTVEAIAPPPQPGAAAASSSLLEETRLLAAAQRELQRAAPEDALRVLDLHARRFSAGVLEQEREAARVLALCALGRLDQARSTRQRFFQRWPGSPMVSRLGTDCAAP